MVAAMARQGAVACEAPEVAKCRAPRGQQRADNRNVEVNQVSVIGYAAGGQADSVGIVAGGARRILILNMAGMFGEAGEEGDLGEEEEVEEEGAEAEEEEGRETAAKSHDAVKVKTTCPLCGHSEAFSYEGHGSWLLCGGCGKAFNPAGYMEPQEG